MPCGSRGQEHCRAVRGCESRVWTASLIQSHHGNFGYFGVPVVSVTLGSTGAPIPSVILGVASVIQIPPAMCVSTWRCLSW